MKNLTVLPNIGKVLASKLIDLGYTNLDQIKSAGAEHIFQQLRMIDEDVCINCLYALEGAITGVRWHDLNEKRKMELKHYFNFLQREFEKIANDC